ncbi:unnamed protein product [Toxocara canis]|uniref:BTB domain-containing protein n=1 Tax=Toxocara canis TaxID=6265 RepID=A0A3P7ISF5_TOXCA|nr:unnamed protein product [Toxocara canis]
MIMACFSDERDEIPKQLLFIHRFSYNVLRIDSRIHSTSFATAYGSRCIEWLVLNCYQQTIIYFNLLCCILMFVRIRDRHKFDSLNGDDEVKKHFRVGAANLHLKRCLETSMHVRFIMLIESETKEALFSGFYVVPDSCDFFTILFRTLAQPKFEGGQINFLIHLSFLPQHFLYSAIHPETGPPTSLLPTDFRVISLNSIIAKQRDFKIMVKDGEIHTSKYLLYVTMSYFHDLLCANPFASFARLNFNKEVVIAVLDFALKGTFNLTAEQIDKIGEFLRCVRATKPIGYETIVRYIGSILVDRVSKHWRSVSLDDAARMFDIAYEHGFVALLDGSMNLIADQYYADFRLYYNESSEGEQGAIFRRLNHSDIADFLAPTNVLTESFRKHGTSLRILKYGDRTAAQREIIS